MEQAPSMLVGLSAREPRRLLPFVFTDFIIFPWGCQEKSPLFSPCRNGGPFTPGSGSGGDPGRGPGRGRPDGEEGAGDGGAGDGDPAPMAVYDALGDGQPQTVAPLAPGRSLSVR